MSWPNRLEDPDLLTGRAQFIADLTESDLGLNDSFTHAAFVRSPVAHARVISIGVETARQAPGVQAVFTNDHLDVAPTQPWTPTLPVRFTQPLLADGVVRFAGEPIAVVLASSAAEAIDAAELVDVELEPLEVVVDPRDAATDRTRLFDTNVVERLERLVLDPLSTATGESIMEGCEVVITHELDVPRQTAAPIEPRGLITWWDSDHMGDSPDHLHAWATTQRPHGYRDQLSALLAIDSDRIHITCPSVGGGFGGKPSRGAEEHVLPVVARLAGRPVRWVESRSDNLIASNHARAEGFRIRLGGDRSGKLTAVDVDMVKDAGAYPTSCALLPAAYTVDNICGCYTFERAAFASVSTATNTAPVSAYRGAGRAPYIAALESAVDVFAHEIGMDPAEVRRRNLVPASTMPWTTPAGSVYDEADYLADLEAVLSVVGYDAWRQHQSQLQSQRQSQHDQNAPSSSMIGIGVACYNHKTGSAGGEEAVVSITAGGGVRVVTGTTDQGHGHRTAWTQIVTSQLGIPAEKVQVVEGVTDAIGSGQGAIGSRSIQTAGAAIHNSCDELIERSRALAAAELEASVDDIVFSVGSGTAALTNEPNAELAHGHTGEQVDGRFHVVGTPARFVRWSDVAERARETQVDLTCGDLHEPEHVSYPSGAHVAVVELDADTGNLRLLAFGAADDVGTRLSPTIVDGQLHGGIAAGIGQVLGEEMVYDKLGNPLTGNFASYQIPTADELPSFKLAGTDGRSSFHPHGYKGVGESGTVGATPAVLNAVNDALRKLGAQPIGLPCTAERIWQSINA